MIKFLNTKITLIGFVIIAFPLGVSFLIERLPAILDLGDIGVNAAPAVSEELNQIHSVAGIQDLIKPEVGLADYDREDYGGWIDADNDCLNTRHEMLLSASVIPPKLSMTLCTVISGQWLDPYSGEMFTEASKLDIDHVVPLKWAHESGASTWTSEEKRAFANDISNLLPVSASLNREKGASPPSEWLPPNEIYRCEYIIKFYRIARRYDLLTPSQAIQLRTMKREYCR